MTDNLASTAQGRIARKFAGALVAGKFATTHSLLSAELQSSLTVLQLQEQYTALIAYGSPPNHVAVMNVLDDWPDKQAGDVGWAYVAISGDNYSEAVAVVVAKAGSRTVIRQVEWGRP